MIRKWTKVGVTSSISALLVLTTACASGEKNAADKPSATADQNQSKPQGPLKLSVQLEGWSDIVPKDGSPMEKEIDKRTNTDLSVNWINYSNYDQRFNVQLASGDLPDVVATVMPNGQLFSASVIQAIKAGKFHDLTKYIEDPDFAKKYPNLAKYDKSVWDNLKFKGKIYALPRYLQPVAADSAIIVRKDLVDKAGLKDEPKTIDELGDFLIKLSQSSGIYALQTTSKDLDNDNYKPLEVAFTGVQDWGADKDGNFVYQSFMPEYDNFLLWMKKLYDAKAIDPEFALQQKGSDFSKGQSASMIHVWWNWKQGPKKSPFKDEVKQKSPDAKAWAFLPVQGPKAYTVSIKPFNRPVLINSKVPESDIPRILKLYDYTASQEYYDLTQTGIEGVHYAMKDGKKELNDQYKQDAVGHWNVMFQNKLTTVDDMLQDAKNVGVSQTDMDRMKAIYTASEKEAKDANLSNPQWSVESPTYFSRWGNLVKDLNDNRIKVIMGKMTIQQWDEYVKSLVSSADYQKIIKEMKDDYKAGK